MVGDAVAVEIGGQRAGGGHKVIPRPVVARIGEAGRVEKLLVEIDHGARHVLRQAHQRALPGEGIQRLRVELLGVNALAARQVGADRLDGAAGHKRAIAAIVDEKEIGWRVGGKVGGEAAAKVARTGNVEQFDAHVGVGRREGIGQRLVGRVVGRVT